MDFQASHADSRNDQTNFQTYNESSEKLKLKRSFTPQKGLRSTLSTKMQNPSVSTFQLSLTPGFKNFKNSNFSRTRHSTPFNLSQKLKQISRQVKSESSVIDWYGNQQANFVDSQSDDQIVHQLPILKWCAFCKKEVATEVQFVNSRKTFWSSMTIFLMGGCLGCFMIPYVTDTCKEIERVCHNCKRSLN